MDFMYYLVIQMVYKSEFLKMYYKRKSFYKLQYQ